MLKHLARRLGPAAFLFAFLVTAVLGPTPMLVSASSPRAAAPLSYDPQAENTDVYAFVSPDRLIIAPDCGLSQTARWAARQKLVNMVEGVTIVRKELGLA